MPILRTLHQGAIAGFIGSGIMHGFRVGWEITTDNRVRDGIFGFDHEADINSARLLLYLLTNESPSAPHAATLGVVLHYAYGSMLGALYAVARTRKSWLGTARGGLLGVVLWAFADEAPISLAGISNPFRKSEVSHGGALAAHLLFGMTVEKMFRAFTAATETF